MQNRMARSIAIGIAVLVGLVPQLCLAAFTSTFNGDGSVTNFRAEERPSAESGVADEFSWGEGSLVDAHSFNFIFDSPGDILLIDATIDVTAGSVFNDLDRSDTNPPSSVFSCGGSPFRHFCPNIPDFDLWLTTPGATAAANGASFGQGMKVTHFDTTFDHDITDFHFAHITLVPNENGYAQATFFGEIQTSGNAGRPEFNQFTVTMSFGAVPEPSGTGLVCSAILMCFATLRRRVRRNLEVG